MSETDIGSESVGDSGCSTSGLSANGCEDAVFRAMGLLLRSTDNVSVHTPVEAVPLPLLVCCVRRDRRVPVPLLTPDLLEPDCRFLDLDLDDPRNDEAAEDAKSRKDVRALLAVWPALPSANDRERCRLILRSDDRSDDPCPLNSTVKGEVLGNSRKPLSLAELLRLLLLRLGSLSFSLVRALLGGTTRCGMGARIGMPGTAGRGAVAGENWLRRKVERVGDPKMVDHRVTL